MPGMTNSGLGASIGNGIGNGTGPADRIPRHPVPPWKLGTWPSLAG